MRKTKASMLIIAATAITVATLFLLPYTPRPTVSTSRVVRGDLVMTTLIEGAVTYMDEQPCVALCAGKVSGVYVAKGQRVSEGELLFTLDSSYEENAVAALSALIYEQETLLSSMPYSEAVAVACAQSLMDMRVQLSELRAQAELKRVRAPGDGVIGGVYVREGDGAMQGAPLGLIYSEGRQLSALCRAADAAHAQTGTPANVYAPSGKRLGLAVLSATGAPSYDESSAQLMQTLRFTPVDDSVLADADIGDSVTVELLTDTLPDKALAPISAVDGDDLLWLVDGGRATPVKVDAGRRNESFVCVPERYIGCSVILTPDAYDLYSGCPVKEPKKK